MSPDTTMWLEQLTPAQLDLVRSKIEEIAAQKKERLKNLGAVSVDDLATDLDIDISSLERQINSSIRRK